MQNVFKCQYITVIVVSLHDVYPPIFLRAAQKRFYAEVQRKYLNSKGL